MVVSYVGKRTNGRREEGSSKYMRLQDADAGSQHGCTRQSSRLLFLHTHLVVFFGSCQVAKGWMHRNVAKDRRSATKEKWLPFAVE